MLEPTSNYDVRGMPIYEFECESCGARFEELIGAGQSAACPSCGAEETHRVFSSLSPPSRQPRGAAVRSNESQRKEREAARLDRIADHRKGRS